MLECWGFMNVSTVDMEVRNKWMYWNEPKYGERPKVRQKNTVTLCVKEVLHKLSCCAIEGIKI